MEKVSLSISSDTLQKLIEYASIHGMKLSKAAEVLLSQALDPGSIDSGEPIETERILQRLDDIESSIKGSLDNQTERIAKVTSRGTKASLASLIGLVSYLPAIGNLTNANYHLTRGAWESIGYRVRDQKVEIDEATLLEMREQRPSDFLDFCWAAGGRAASYGSAMDYASVTRGLKRTDFAHDALSGLSEDVIDLLEGRAFDEQEQILLLRLSDIEASLKGFDVIEDLDSYDKKIYQDSIDERAALLAEFKARRRRMIGKPRTRLVPSEDGSWEAKDDE